MTALIVISVSPVWALNWESNLAIRDILCGKPKPDIKSANRVNIKYYSDKKAERTPN
jgi:hypothetical protein